LAVLSRLGLAVREYAGSRFIVPSHLSKSLSALSKPINAPHPDRGRGQIRHFGSSGAAIALSARVSTLVLSRLSCERLDELGFSGWIQASEKIMRAEAPRAALVHHGS
jgi:hypothetical protein